MKRHGILLSLLLIISIISGWLLSKASLVGRAGINLFYKEYKFLKTWWQAGLAVLFGLLVFWLVHYLLFKMARRSRALLFHSLLLIISIAGLYFTYNDFRTDMSHRFLGERFHLGAYLFWLGTILIAIFYLFPGSGKDVVSNSSKSIE